MFGYKTNVYQSISFEWFQRYYIIIFTVLSHLHLVCSFVLLFIHSFIYFVYLLAWFFLISFPYFCFFSFSFFIVIVIVVENYSQDKHTVSVWIFFRCQHIFTHSHTHSHIHANKHQRNTFLLEVLPQCWHYIKFSISNGKCTVPYRSFNIILSLFFPCLYWNCYPNLQNKLKMGFEEEKKKKPGPVYDEDF